MANEFFFILIGIAAGCLSGLIGVGGGIIVIPSLVYLFGFTMHKAQGTTLAMLLPPIGIFAVLTYYKEGFVDLKVALLLCLGFLFGGWLGAKIAVGLSNLILKKIFAVILILVAIEMFFSKK
jgi:uncharacterized protein